MSHTDGESRERTETDFSQRCVLIVEPDRLTRWSMEEYLRDKCEVASADCAAAAHRLLDTEQFNAVVIADDLPHDGADAVEQHACDRNPDIAVVRTVTHLSDDAGRASSRAILLEKPFELVSLAQVLGFEGA